MLAFCFMYSHIQTFEEMLSIKISKHCNTVVMQDVILTLCFLLLSVVANTCKQKTQIHALENQPSMSDHKAASVLTDISFLTQVCFSGLKIQENLIKRRFQSFCLKKQNFISKAKVVLCHVHNTHSFFI